MIYGPNVAKAVLSVHLREGQHLSTETMWRYIDRLKIYKYHKALDVFKTTIDLWYCLQPHPAIQLLILSQPKKLRKIDHPDTILATE